MNRLYKNATDKNMNSSPRLPGSKVIHIITSVLIHCQILRLHIATYKFLSSFLNDPCILQNNLRQDQKCCTFSLS